MNVKRDRDNNLPDRDSTPDGTMQALSENAPADDVDKEAEQKLHESEGRYRLLAKQLKESEQRTQKALDGLLAMAEALVQLPESTQELYSTGRQLVDMTHNMLECEHVALQMLEPETEILRPLAVAGLSREQESEWWEEPKETLQSIVSSEIVARLRHNEVLTSNIRQIPYSTRLASYKVTTILIAPMCVSNQLTGLLTLDYSSKEHHFTDNEITIASAVARLAALILERQRLLRERTEAAGRELALHTANSRMEEFLGIASHELRTPLTTIKANVQLSLRRLKNVIQQAETLSTEVISKITMIQDMLTRAEHQVGVLNRLVGDLIDISRIQTGKLQLHLRQKPCDLAQIVQETIQGQHTATPERTIQLEMHTQRNMSVIADPDRITQVLTNYLSNALKYSYSYTPVTVFLDVEESAYEGNTEAHQKIARVSVRDQGQGLPPQEQKRIWECFYQAEGIKVLSGSGVGLGLGLYISQTIIQRHHGQVGVKSTGQNGSTFWFTLPLV